MFRARHTPAPLTQLRAQPGALRPRLCKGGPAPEPQLYTREPAPLDPGKAESPQSAAARLRGLGRGPDPHRRVPRVPGVPGPRPAKPPALAPARGRPPNVAAQAELHSGEERRAREGGEARPASDRGPRPPAAARPRPSSGQAGRGARARRPGTGPGSPRAGDRFGGAGRAGAGPGRAGHLREPGTSTARVNKEAVENCTYVYDRRGSRAASARGRPGRGRCSPWPG